MSAPPDPPPRPRTPLDETLWRQPVFLSTWGLHAQNIMQYFHESPFFDATSNNGMLIAQMSNNHAMAMQITSQEAFDARLREMRGEEYVCIGGSEETGVWVVRKQRRWGRGEAEVVRLATYYVVGPGNVYQAPSVGEVVANRVLNITSALRRSLQLASETLATAPSASSVPNPASTTTASNSFNSASTSTQSQPPQTQTQSASTPASTAPGIAMSTQQSSSSSKPSQTRTKQDEGLMRGALALTLKHVGEYMDDHAPLLGDGGGFIPHPGAAGAGGPAKGTAAANAGGAVTGSGTPRPGTASATGTSTPVGGVQGGAAAGGGVKGLDVRRSLLVGGAKK